MSPKLPPRRLQLRVPAEESTSPRSATSCRRRARSSRSRPHAGQHQARVDEACTNVVKHSYRAAKDSSRWSSPGTAASSRSRSATRPELRPPQRQEPGPEAVRRDAPPRRARRLPDEPAHDEVHYRATSEGNVLSMSKRLDRRQVRPGRRRAPHAPLPVHDAGLGVLTSSWAPRSASSSSGRPAPSGTQWPHRRGARPDARRAVGGPPGPARADVHRADLLNSRSARC